jgi:hypothetical protein
MKRTDEPIDPEVIGQLDAIDATLAGDPVDPEYAELAELALLLAADRPQVDPAFATRMDARVERRFVAAPDAAEPGRPRRSWSFGQLAGLASAAVAAVVVVVVLGSGGSGSHPVSPVAESTVAGSSAAPAAGVARSHGSSSGSAASSSAGANNDVLRGPAQAVGPTVTSAGASSPAPQPPSNGRRIVQSANLALNAAASRIDDVAQELFDVVGRENGVVNNSSVTAGTDGYAQFQLSIPSGNLTATMTQLSQLRYAHVSSRTDSTQDVNGQYVSAGRRLADDQALRTSLLKQLAGAVTQNQIDSLKTQIHDVENAIARDQAAIRALNNRINYSRVQVTINASASPIVRAHSSSGFTLGKAAHDAGRVLTVAAGVALITLAALVPVLLVGALGWWIAAALRRRRREQALDLA